MKKQEVSAFQSDWEYRQAQREERKQDRNRREARRGKTNRFIPKGADE